MRTTNSLSFIFPPVQPTSFRNILFSVHSSVAKDVYIIGDFTKWFREPLTKKKGNLWTLAKKLTPGTYEYLYVVDGRRVKDPNNKKVSNGGKSLITVKPIPGS